MLGPLQLAGSESKEFVNMKKYFLFVLVALFVAGLIFLFKVFMHEPDVTGEASFEAVKEGANKRQDISSSKQDDKKSVENASEEFQPDEEQLSREQIYEKNEWLRKHGFESTFNVDGSPLPVNEPLSDYNVYSIETLKAMADGDPRAALELGLRFKDKSEYIKSRTYLRSAAVHGYAKGLVALSGSYAQEAKNLLKKKDKNQEADKLLTESYAWGHVIHLRFYPEETEPAISGKPHIEDERLQAIKKAAKERALELYEELQSERSSLGLGEFDNEIPDTFKL